MVRPDVDGVELLDKLDEEVDGERRNLFEKPPKAEEPLTQVWSPMQKGSQFLDTRIMVLKGT